MSIQSFLAKPALRIPLLVGTVIATVATSEPGWGLSDTTDSRTVHVDAGATVDTTLALDGSHPVFIDADLENVVAREGKLRIEAIDSRPECKPNDKTFESDDGIWRVARTSPESATPGSKLHRIEFSSSCIPTGTTATVTIRFHNEGKTPLDFDWKATASISGRGTDDVPDGAFVHVEVQE